MGESKQFNDNLSSSSVNGGHCGCGGSGVVIAVADIVMLSLILCNPPSINQLCWKLLHYHRTPVWFERNL